MTMQREWEDLDTAAVKNGHGFSQHPWLDGVSEVRCTEICFHT